METLKAIVARAEPFLRERQRSNWVSLVSSKGVEAILFYNAPTTDAKDDDGVCLQFSDPAYCYCLTDAACWRETGHGDGASMGKAVGLMQARAKAVSI